MHNFILIIFLVLCSTVFFNNKTIKKETTKNNLKTLDQEGQSYRLVTSADNVQVPVPKGYVASQITGENYVTPEYQHTTNTYKGNSTELTWSSPAGEQYPWTQDSNGIWISGNQGIPNSTSTLESEEFDYIKGTTLTINYTYSTEYIYDYLEVYLINLTNNTTQRIISKNGNTYTPFDYTTSNYTYTIDDFITGRYKLRATYNKNSSRDGGADSGYIKTSTYFKEDENGTETYEEDIKTKIHDGGFVIYQLTDTELETDPNGTSVIINDTNKNTVQRTRNQYVWVPIQNVEDIVRTKTANNGIKKFGQNYTFSTTSITKETNTSSESYSEPRLVEEEDKTKYYLQGLSNIHKRENHLNEQEEDFTSMIKSINKYKGFYIGRYETGDDVSHSSSENCFTNPKVVRYNSNINHVTWYNSYIALKRLSGKTGKYVESGMIYDSLWDYTLKWLNETDARSYEEIYIDSGTWGGYGFSNTVTVTSGSTNVTDTGAIETITYKQVTYSNSPTASNNIFDIAGNVEEFTRSRCNSYCRRERGGSSASYSNVKTASYIDGDRPSNRSAYLGVRAQLYIL